MQVDIVFDFAKVYDISKADILLGQKFSLLPDDKSGRWFSDNDKVLDIDISENRADVIASSVGSSIILIMNDEFTVIKRLDLNVTEPQAVSLGLTASAPVPK